mgnify:CR=1 FL=1
MLVSVAMRGGANLMMLSWVGLAIRPFFSILRENSQASFFFAVNSIPMKRPLPLTSLTLELLKMDFRPLRSFYPCLVEF